MQHELDKLYREHSSGLRRFFRSRVNDADPDDFLQEVFVQAATHADALGEIRNAAAWLYRIARNKVIDWYRRRRRVAANTDTLDALLGDLDLVASDQSFQDDSDRELLLEALFDAIDELPPIYRDVVLAQALDGKTFRDLSLEWEVPINTLLSRKSRALGLLSEALSDFRDYWNDL